MVQYSRPSGQLAEIAGFSHVFLHKGKTISLANSELKKPEVLSVFRASLNLLNLDVYQKLGGRRVEGQ